MIRFFYKFISVLISALIIVTPNSYSLNQDLLRPPMQSAKASFLRTDALSLMKALKFTMDILGLKEDKRILNILKNSLDPIAFIGNLIAATKGKKSENEVLEILMNIPALRAKALKYKERKAILGDGLGQGESTCTFLSIGIGVDGAKISMDSDTQRLTPGQALSDLLLEQYTTARGTPFVYRDGMDLYVGRFLGLYSEKPEAFRQEKINGQELSDLQEEIEKLKAFFRGESGKGRRINLSHIQNLVSNGIGANEMYLHQLAQMLNQMAEALGIDFHWEVVDNPADFQRVKENCIAPTTDNTLAYDESRSGGTVEPADFMEMTCKSGAGLYINRRVVWANGGRFYKLGEQLVEQDSSASVLHIDNTPGNIGGRHMNLKTGMVYGPLFTALAIMGYKIYGNEDGALAWATEQLKIYVQNLHNANLNLTPKQDDADMAIYNPASQISTEMVRKRDVQGHVKLAIVFDPGLRHFATEYFQNTNEGIAKPAKGDERNNNMHSFWNAGDGNLDYMRVFGERPELYQPIFLVDKSSEYAGKMLAEARRLKEKGIPVKIVTLDLKKIGKRDSADEIKSKFAHNLAVQAQATALLQTVVTTFTHLTDQDANSNPAVKITREVTAAIQDILIEREKSMGRPLQGEESRVTLRQIMQKMQETKEKDGQGAREKLAAAKQEPRAKTEPVLPDIFQDFIDATLKPLAKDLGVDEEVVARVFIGSISRAVFSADMAESGGLKSALVDEALASAEFGRGLGELTHDFSLEQLSNQVDVYSNSEEGITISVACPEKLSRDERGRYENRSKENLPQAIADYYYDRYVENNRARTLNTIGVGYVDADTGSQDITDIMATVNNLLAEFGINSLPMNFPRIAHTGIEAAQALAEIITIVGLIPTQSFPEGEGQLGSVKIKEGLTVNGANKIYILSNIARMALGSSPTVIFEYRDQKQLDEIKQIMVDALKILADKIRTAPHQYKIGPPTRTERSI